MSHSSPRSRANPLARQIARGIWRLDWPDLTPDQAHAALRTAELLTLAGFISEAPNAKGQ